MTLVITMLHGPFQHSAPEFLSSQYSMTESSQCSIILLITMFHDHVITILHDLCHHNALCRFSSQFSKTTLITLLADHFHPISLLSSQFPIVPFLKCSLMPVITMLHGFCYQNAPGPVSSQYSIPHVITVHNETFHYNAP